MFVQGDIIRRIKNVKHRDAATLPIGKLYRVRGNGDMFDGNPTVHLINVESGEFVNGSWFSRNFELHTSAFSPTGGPCPVNGRALPTDSEARKLFPLFSGCLAYFPAALAEVSNHSYLGNEKHNPGKPLQHARNKSGDHLDCTLRHIVDSREVEGRARIEELRAAAWRILAELQEELERQGTKTAPAATFD